MKSKIVLLVLLLGIAACSQKVDTTFKDQRWYRGNLHTHSYWSDGDEFPEVVMGWYKSNGYDFVALSDHNILAMGDKWITIREDSIYQAGFQNYLRSYGSDWVIYRTDSNNVQVKLKKLEEYRDRFEEEGEFLIIQSEEITDRFENKPVHLNATNIQELIQPQGGNSVQEVLQNNIDEVIRQREQTGVPMIPHVNHPNFGYGISLEDMIGLRGERFFEVYNGHPSVHNQGDSTHISTESMWDLINIAYLSEDKPLMYGLATDDSHNYHLKGSNFSNAGRGWIMVRADSLTPVTVIDALEAGDFYSTTGVILEKLEYQDNILSVEVDPEELVEYTIEFIGCRSGEMKPEIFKSTENIEDDFEITGDILYVRCKITSSKLQDNPIEDLIYEMAWTQPVIFQK